MNLVTKEFKIKKKFDIFVLLVTFELLSYYPNIMQIIQIIFNPIGLMKTFSGSQIKFSLNY